MQSNLRHLLLFVFLSVLVGSGAGQQDCSVKPVTLPFKNVTVNRQPDRTSHHKTVPIHLGAGDAPLAVGFATNLNGSFVPDSGTFCKPGLWNTTGCIFWRGGLYNYTSSSTFRPDDKTEANNNISCKNSGYDFLHKDEYESEGYDPLSLFPRGWDKLRFGDAQIERFPFSIIDNESFPFSVGVIGAASDSNFLKVAVKTKAIPSRSFGHEFGQNAPGQETEGQIVLGGYNADRVSYKDFYNFTLFPDKSKPCPLQVTVKAMRMGSGFNVKDSFMACVEPGYHTMIMPQHVQRAWNDTMKQRGYAFWKATWEYYYFNKTVDSLFPEDDLEIELDGGLTVRIPPGEMVQQAQQVDDAQGLYTPIHGAVNTFIGHAGFEDKDVRLPFLGGAFLSQLYLAVDYESNIFSLAPLSSPSPKIANLKPNTITLGCKASKSDQDDGNKSRKRKTTVAAAAVGSVAGVLAIAAVGFFLYKRHRRRQPQTVEPEPVKELHYNPLPSPYSTFSGSGASGTDHPGWSPRTPTTPGAQTPTLSYSTYQPSLQSGPAAYIPQEPVEVPSVYQEPVELRGDTIVSPTVERISEESAHPWRDAQGLEPRR